MTEDNPRKPSDAVSWETRKAVEISIKIGDLKKACWFYRHRHDHSSQATNWVFEEWKLNDSEIDFLVRVTYGDDEEMYYRYSRELPSKISPRDTKYHVSVVEDRHFSSTFHITFKKARPESETEDRWQSVFSDRHAKR